MHKALQEECKQRKDQLQGSAAQLHTISADTMGQVDRQFLEHVSSVLCDTGKMQNLSNFANTFPCVITACCCCFWKSC